MSLILKTCFTKMSPLRKTVPLGSAYAGAPRQLSQEAAIEQHLFILLDEKTLWACLKRHLLCHCWSREMWPFPEASAAASTHQDHLATRGNLSLWPLL